MRIARLVTMAAALHGAACGGGGDGPVLAPLPVGLLVASRGSDRVLRYDGSGRPQGVFAADPALVRPVGLTFGPDCDLYVAAGDTDHVLRFDGATGSALGVFTHGALIESPRNVNFGPDGAFYVADGVLDEILRFDGSTGAYDRVFIVDPALDRPTSFTFGPDGNVSVGSVNTNAVLEFDGGSGALIAPFATANLAQPHDVSFGPDGNLYVTNSRSGIVQRFHGDTGAAMGPFVTDPALRSPLGMAWGPDGNLYVANQGGNDIRRYDGVTGAPLGVFAGGDLAAPAFLVFLPTAELALAASVDAARGGVLLAVAGARPGARVLLAEGAAGGTSAVPGCPGLELAIGDATIDQTRSADESGDVVAAVAAVPGRSVSYVAVDAARCRATAPVTAQVATR